MAEILNLERDLQHFSGRLIAAGAFVLLCFALLGARLVWLQVFRHDELTLQAEANRIAVVPVVPNRGLIVDRNGVVLASNYSAYTLEVAPRRNADLEALIEELSQVVEITARDRRRFKRLQEEMKGAESLPIRTKLSDAEVARFMAQRFRFPGVEIKARLFRHYPLGETGSHLLGYIGRINQAEKAAMDDWPDERVANYRGTEYIGKLGLEQAYETELHGTTGVEEVETSAGGRPVRRLASTPPTPGNQLWLSVDIRLQALVEELFGERRGALVAIDPRNGEILAFVSKPTFDPNLFVDGIDPKNWDELNNDPDKPLLNRALRGTYPIGSTYKPFLGLAGLELGKRTPETVIIDPGFFMYGNHKFRDSAKVPLGPVNLHRSIVQSSDVYYYKLADDLGVDAIHDYMKPWGFGQLTGVDMEGEQQGILPSTEWKMRRFNQRWYGGETISVGIGQGYNAFTLLQLAHATATLANEGSVMKPHLVKQIENSQTGEKRFTVPKESYRIPLKPENLKAVIDAMVDVNISGTGRHAFAGVPYKVAGKTGTAQVITIKQNEKYDESRIDERYRDHSLFMAFAPADKPTIALALLVENGGFGARAAAPIARQVLDYYLLGKVPRAPADLSNRDEAPAAAPTAPGKAVPPVAQSARWAQTPAAGAGAVEVR
ncbi:MAG: penicillin-binding protein 2 [Betaproteobacteria bacterium]